MQSDSPKEKIQPEKTAIIDMSKNLESSEDFLKNRELSRSKSFPEKFYGNEPLTEDLKKKLKMMEYSEPVKMNDEPNIHKKGSPVSKYIEAQQSLAGKERKREEIRAKQADLEKEVAEKRKMGLGKKLVSETLDKPSRFTKILKALGSRVSKAIPFLGAGVGALSAKEALAKGDKLGAALETASMLDPTPISDVILAGKDIYDIVTEKDEVKKTIEPVIKVVGGDPDMKPSKASKLTGEKSSPDLEEMDNSVNYEDYLKKKKRQLGYE
jgi:hypothetical protein